jgi:hypothetical protein
VQSPTLGAYATDHLAKLLAFDFDRSVLANKRLPYELLDQLTIEVLLGAR